MRLTLALLLVSLVPVCGSALAGDAALLQCRNLTDAAVRLACYDAIKVAAAPPAAPLAAPIATPLAAPLATPAPTLAAREQAFGLQQSKASELQSITSTIPGNFDGWRPGTRITLANGQVWRVADESVDDVSGTNLKVTIERNIFGTTFMVIEGTNLSPRVKRVQ